MCLLFSVIITCTVFCTEIVVCLVWSLMLAWNSKIQMWLGHFGLAMVGREGLRLEKDIQIKGSLMGRLDPADMFVQRSIID